MNRLIANVHEAIFQTSIIERHELVDTETVRKASARLVEESTAIAPLGGGIVAAWPLITEEIIEMWANESVHDIEK